MRWVKCIGSEGWRGRLRTYIANIAVTLCGHDQLQQFNNQINTPEVPQNTYVSWEDISKNYRQRSVDH